MTTLLRHSIDPLDWAALEELDFVEAMRGCEQDPEWHAEGDVFVHTRMVLDALSQLPAFGALDDETRWQVATAALLHDVAKPQTTRRDPDGRITARGHSAKGAIRARRILWSLGVPIVTREAICRIIRHHQVPFFLVEKPDARRTARRLSVSLRCEHLALVTEADGRGRRCADQEDLLARVELFRTLCEEEGVLDRPYPFADAHSRFEYLRTAGRDPSYAAFDDTVGEVVVMSGLPASGKDTLVARRFAGWPSISLDALRRELDVHPDHPDQGPVYAEARERARAWLREGRSFVWNSTNVTRDARARIIDLAARYRMRTRIVYLECSAPEQKRRNDARARPVPAHAIEGMLARWDVPSEDEAHVVELIDTSAPGLG